MIDWFDQDHVSSLRVAIVGVGAVGNEVAKNLVLLGVGHLSLYDLDTVEAHNLTRSVLFRPGDVGKTKVACARLRLRELNDEVGVAAYHGDFWKKLTVRAARGYDCIVSCLDNFEARVRLNQLCSLLRIPLINTGVDSRFAVAEFFPFKDGGPSPCYECTLPPSAYERISERYSCGWLRKRAFEERKIPTTIVTAAAAAGAATNMVLREIVAGSSQSRRVLMDTISYTSTVAELRRREGCPGCRWLGHDAHWVSSRRTLTAGFSIPAASRSGATIWCSDQVVLSMSCRNPLCERVGKSTDLLRPADEFDDSAVKCACCGQNSIDLDIRDQFTADVLLDRFAGFRMPGKWLVVAHDDRLVCMDLEEADE